MNSSYLISHPYLLSANDMSKQDIYELFALAQHYMDNFNETKKFDDLAGFTVGLAFFENSTRTRISFELAAQRLSADVFAFQSQSSSLAKGESLIDTLHTLEAMGVQIFVVRHNASGAPKFLQDNTKWSIINAGDGQHEHPTQSLLDSFTLYRHFKKFEGLKVAIVGDIKHSRVARSNLLMLKTLGAELGICAPGTFLPTDTSAWDAHRFNRIEEAVEWADVILLLRIQRERMESGLLPSIGEYTKYYGLDRAKMASKPELVVLHPGPVNYGVELEREVTLSNKNTLIQTQVTSGVFTRMALLSLIGRKIKAGGYF